MANNRILIVNNYSMKKSLDMIESGVLPRHHAWGIDRLMESNKLRFLNYQCPKWMSKLHLAHAYYMLFQIQTLVMSIGCSKVFSAASPLIDLLAYLKHKRIIRKQLYMVVHHPKNFTLHNKDYDRLFFITKVAYNQALLDNPGCNGLFIYDEWGPDVNFYSDALDKKKSHGNSVSFISIGKANRDYVTLIEANRGLDSSVRIICTEKNIPKNYDRKTDKNIDLYIQGNNSLMSGKLMSYKQMAEEMVKSDVAVIPVPKTNTALCGLTSFDDAIALGMPVIVSDTTFFGIDVEGEGIGFVYKAGNAEDLRLKMKRFIDNPELIETMGKKAYEYACAHSSDSFSGTILKAMN